ncbi:MAG TPA: PD-(D/E)XK nuclease family protein [Acidimicrobiales bacterium]|nr:PD-(D/E)XK nuclease family protein [Acidimicrobiales bacterium]
MNDSEEKKNSGLNPAQQAVLDQLGASRDERPIFAEDLGYHIRGALETAIEPYLSAIPSNEDFFLSKHELGQIHGCQTKYLAEREQEFEWAVNIARGSIVHKAVELAMNWRKEIEASVLIDEALARYEQDSGSLGYWLQGCSEIDRAELRSESLDAFAKYLECWPPLRSAWHPVSESRMRAELCDRRFILSGRVDLTLGTAEGFRAGKVIVDLKTGSFSPLHVEDLRFYALIETLRIGVPPRLLATYYLDSAQFSPEEVTEDLLMATVARVIDAVEKYVSLIYEKQEPKNISGPQCRWCVLASTCATGQSYLEEGI